MKIRRARHEDASSLAAISIEVWMGTYIREGVNGFFADYALNEFTTANFETLISKSNEKIWVSENINGIDGFLRLTTDKTTDVPECPSVELTTLYVQNRHQGKGIGRALLQQALTEGDLWLMVNAENVGAAKFYQKHGFAKVGEAHFKIQDEAYLNNILTCKG